MGTPLTKMDMDAYAAARIENACPDYRERIAALSEHTGSNPIDIIPQFRDSRNDMTDICEVDFYVADEIAVYYVLDESDVLTYAEDRVFEVGTETIPPSVMAPIIGVPESDFAGMPVGSQALYDAYNEAVERPGSTVDWMDVAAAVVEELGTETFLDGSWMDPRYRVGGYTIAKAYA